MEACVSSADGHCWCRMVWVWNRGLFVLVGEGVRSIVLVMRVRSRNGSMFPGLVDWEESRSDRYRGGCGGHG